MIFKKSGCIPTGSATHPTGGAVLWEYREEPRFGTVKLYAQNCLQAPAE